MNSYLGYIRVSTAKQGEGVSLEAQKEAISRYAERYGFQIARWFEELETAAKRGRPVFNQMLKLLRLQKARGVIMHKIDRSARNLKDWADLGELIDKGIEVHFANESLDLNSRGGRLSADIQAVVAADYIRNLREESRKGFYGRIKQGFFPLPAPLGYIDKGKGKPKEIDTVQGSLVRKAFELYGTGKYSFGMLLEEMYRLGLRNKRGSRVTLNGISIILNNPFYIGLIRLKRTGETFPGSHEALIPKSLFDRVQQILDGKTVKRVRVHEFLFRRMLCCKGCSRNLIGECQKGHTYYRCQTRNCPQKTLREEIVEEEIMKQFEPLRFNEREKEYFHSRIKQLSNSLRQEEESLRKALELRLAQIGDRLNRLTDAYIDGVIEQKLYEDRKAALLNEEKSNQERLTLEAQKSASLENQLSEFLELAGSAWNLYKLGLPEEKRDLLKIVTSNRLVSGKSVELILVQPFQEVANRLKNTYGGAYRDRTRTVDSLIEYLLNWFKGNPKQACSQYRRAA